MGRPRKIGIYHLMSQLLMTILVITLLLLNLLEREGVVELSNKEKVLGGKRWKRERKRMWGNK